jgi:ATP-dependent Clp protease, protease subunit
MDVLRIVPAKSNTMLQESLRASYHYVPQGAKVTAHSSGTQMRARGFTAMGRQGGRARSPPPDLPSLLLDARIVFIGLPLVASVTELVVSELLWLQYADSQKPIYMYINSIGSQEDFQAIGFETEAYAIQDTMNVCLAPMKQRLVALVIMWLLSLIETAVIQTVSSSR